MTLRKFLSGAVLMCTLSSYAIQAQESVKTDDPVIKAWGRETTLSKYLDGLTGMPEDSTFRPTAWGDQHNGTYINPVLNADFSDPDAIRVEDKYYMVASDFHFMGMQVLESDDLVNWRYISQIYSRLDYPGWDTNSHYSNGSWAPSIRYHDGKFYVFFCTPKEGLFMSCAEKAEGPWSELILVHEGTGRGWEDPCPFWDEDGQAYLGRSQVGAGPIIIHKMSPDGTRLLDEGVEVYRGNVAEGTKIHKWNGYYYLSIPEGGVGPGNQVILRSANIYGPYDRKVVLETGSTPINGPHQGAIIDSPDGSWWFMHFQLTPVLGRVVHLQPMHWQDGWPVIGVDIDRNGIGEPVFSWQMPESLNSASRPNGVQLCTSDGFNSPTMGLQWQFNHNPVNDKWSLSEKPGKLTIHALKAANFAMARNTLTQKLIGYSGEMSVTIETGSMAEGQRAGLVMMGVMNWTMGVKMEGGKKYVYVMDFNDKEVDCRPLSGKTVTLRLTYDVHQKQFQYSFSTDGKVFTDIYSPFVNLYGYWKGARPGLFSYNTLEDAGTAYFDNFKYNYR